MKAVLEVWAVIRDRRLLLMTIVIALIMAGIVTGSIAIGLRAASERIDQALGPLTFPLRLIDLFFGWGDPPKPASAAQRLRTLLGSDYLALFVVWAGTSFLPASLTARRCLDRYFPGFPAWLDGPAFEKLATAGAADLPFVGRAAELDTISTLAATGQSWCVVSGLSGVGKTRLAQQWSATDRLLDVGDHYLLTGKPLKRLGLRAGAMAWLRNNRPARAPWGPPTDADPWDVGLLRPGKMPIQTWDELKPRRRTILVIDRPAATAIPNLIRMLLDRPAKSETPASQPQLVVLLLDNLPPTMAGETALPKVRCPTLTQQDVHRLVEQAVKAPTGLFPDMPALVDHLFKESGGVPLVLRWLIEALNQGKPLEDVTAGSVLEAQARAWIVDVHAAQASHQPGGGTCAVEILALAELVNGLPRTLAAAFDDPPSTSALEALFPDQPRATRDATIPPNPSILVGNAVLHLVLLEGDPDLPARLATIAWTHRSNTFGSALAEAASARLVEYAGDAAILAAMPIAEGRRTPAQLIAAMIDPAHIPILDAANTPSVPAWGATLLALHKQGFDAIDIPERIAATTRDRLDQPAFATLHLDWIEQEIAAGLTIPSPRLDHLHACLAQAENSSPPRQRARAIAMQGLVASHEADAHLDYASAASIAPALNAQRTQLADIEQIAAALDGPPPLHDALAEAARILVYLTARHAADAKDLDDGVKAAHTKEATALVARIDEISQAPDHLATTAFRRSQVRAWRALSYGLSTQAGDAGATDIVARMDMLDRTRRLVLQAAAVAEQQNARHDPLIQAEYAEILRHICFALTSLSAPTTPLPLSDRMSLISEARDRLRVISALADAPEWRGDANLQHEYAIALRNLAYATATMAGEETDLDLPTRLSLLEEAEALADRIALPDQSWRNHRLFTRERAIALRNVAYGFSKLLSDAPHLTLDNRRGLHARLNHRLASLDALASNPSWPFETVIPLEHALALSSALDAIQASLADESAHRDPALAVEWLAEAQRHRKSIDRMEGSDVVYLQPLFHPRLAAVLSSLVGCIGTSAATFPDLDATARLARLKEASWIMGRLSSMAESPRWSGNIEIRRNQTRGLRILAYWTTKLGENRHGLPIPARLDLLASVRRIADRIVAIAELPEWRDDRSMHEDVAMALTSCTLTAAALADGTSEMDDQSRLELLKTAEASASRLASLANQPEWSTNPTILWCHVEAMHACSNVATTLAADAPALDLPTWQRLLDQARAWLAAGGQLARNPDHYGNALLQAEFIGTVRNLVYGTTTSVINRSDLDPATRTVLLEDALALAEAARDHVALLPQPPDSSLTTDLAAQLVNLTFAADKYQVPSNERLSSIRRLLAAIEVGMDTTQDIRLATAVASLMRAHANLENLYTRSREHGLAAHHSIRRRHLAEAHPTWAIVQLEFTGVKRKPPPKHLPPANLPEGLRLKPLEQDPP